MEIKDAPPRPELTIGMVIEAARSIYPGEGEAEAIADCFRRHMDGYELAKALENSAWWDCTRDDVDKLDGVSYAAEQLLRDAEQRWCEENDIQPSLKIGTRLRLPRGRVGEITGIAAKHSPGRYLVKDDDDVDKKDANRRFLIKFEDAVIDE